MNAMELEEVAQWLDSLYVRLQGVELMFATPEGIDAYNGSFKREKFLASVQQDLDRAAQIGIAAGRPMEHCGCLFEALGLGQIPPMEFLLKARSEVNNLSVAVRQLAVDEHESMRKPKPSREQPDAEVTVWYRKNGHKYKDRKEAVRAFTELHEKSKGIADSLYNRLSKDLGKRPYKAPKTRRKIR